MNFRTIPVELICWLTAFTLLAVSVPGEHHFTLCPLARLGFQWCPGCGLGRSIGALLHGNLRQSFHHHWFGVPATLILFHRILILAKIYIKSLHILT